MGDAGVWSLSGAGVSMVPRLGGAGFWAVLTFGSAGI